MMLVKRKVYFDVPESGSSNSPVEEVRVCLLGETMTQRFRLCLFVDVL